MARGAQLLQLVEKFRAETRQSTLPALGTDSLPHVKQLLRRTQEMLYSDPANDWAFLRMWLTKPIQAGNIYYDPPDNLNMDRIEAVYVRSGNEWLPLERGIDVKEYAQYDPDDTTARGFPTERWDLRWTGTSTQIEIWPRPSENSTIRFKCLRPLRPMISDSDVADLDDNLIVLFAAAEELSAQKSKDADTKLQMAQKHLLSFKASAQAGSSTIQMGLSSMGRPSHAVVRVT
jgi:hypothetical protein